MRKRQHCMWFLFLSYIGLKLDYFSIQNMLKIRVPLFSKWWWLYNSSFIHLIRIFIPIDNCFPFFRSQNRVIFLVCYFVICRNPLLITFESRFRVSKESLLHPNQWRNITWVLWNVGFGLIDGVNAVFVFFWRLEKATKLGSKTQDMGFDHFTQKSNVIQVNSRST